MAAPALTGLASGIRTQGLEEPKSRRKLDFRCRNFFIGATGFRIFFSFLFQTLRLVIHCGYVSVRQVPPISLWNTSPFKNDPAYLLDFLW